MRKLILLLIAASAASANGNLCVSQATGSYNWNSASAWATCATSGGVPGDLDWAVWKSSGTLTVNVSVGTSGGGGINWIRQELGTITVSAGVTITFNSTGTNPVGSGSLTNPGSDATMQGFFLAKGTAFNISGTAASRVVLTAANGTSPVYINHNGADYTGCTTFTSNVCNGSAGVNVAYPAIAITYADIYNLGVTGETGYESITLGGPNGVGSAAVSIDHTQFYNPYEVLDGLANGVYTFAFNYIQNPAYKWSIVDGVSSETALRTVTDNTVVLGAAASGAGTLFYSTNGLDSAVFERNAVYGTAIAGWSYLIVNNVSATEIGNTVLNNLEVFPEPASQGGACFTPRLYYSDATSTFSQNVCQGGSASGLYVVSGVGTITFSKNWNSQWYENSLSQGNCCITDTSGSAAGSTHNISNNMMVDENFGASAVIINVLAYTSATNGNIANLDHNTVVKLAHGTGFQFGEGTTTGAVYTSRGRSNIVIGGGGVTGNAAFASSNNNGLNTMSTICSWGGGLCNNLTYNSGSVVYSKAAATANWDNGTQTHPNAVYGDLTINPLLVDSTRRPCGFGKVLGLDGTCTTFFAALATRALGTNGCTVCGTYTDGGYGASGDNVIEAMRKWLFHGAIPQNPQTWCAGHDGEAVGAAPFCAAGKAMLAATAF